VSKFLFIGGPWDGQRRLVKPDDDEVSVLLPRQVVNIFPGATQEPDTFCVYERRCVEDGGMEFFKPVDQSLEDTLTKLIKNYYPKVK